MKNKILLLCGCLENGKDGIGDYTMQLALALSQTNEVAVIALHDKFIDKPSTVLDGILKYRIPEQYSWFQKEVLLTDFINQMKPTWISLQLVAFAFHKKGILREAIRPIKRSIGSIPLHIMLHELWLGENEGSSLKMKLWGKAIRFYLLKLLSMMKPVHIYVSCEVNRYLLLKNNISSTLAPIFSSINVAEIENLDELFQHKVASKLQPSIYKSECLVAGFFGTIHPEWQHVSAVTALQELADINNKKLVILFFGKIQDKEIQRIKSFLPAHSYSTILGIGSPTEISQYVQLCDIGVTSNPELLISKSSSVATFLGHQKPILVSRNDLKVSGFDSKSIDNPLILRSAQLINYFAMPTDNSDSNSNFTATALAERMLIDMTT